MRINFSKNATTNVALFDNQLSLMLKMRLFIFFVIFLAFAFFMTSSVSASTYYISPSGSNSNSGTFSQPWLTFSYSFSQLSAGDTLILKNGTYASGTTGLMDYNCASYDKGTSTQSITIQAENSRQAIVSSDGSAPAVWVRGSCDYLVMDGITATMVDNNTASGWQSSVYRVESSSNITVKNALTYGSNRYWNTHGIVFISVTNGLIESSEVYDFHRHGFSITSSSFITIRQSYANSRFRAGVSGGYEGMDQGGEEGFVFYCTSDSIIENSISENNAPGFAIHGCSGGGKRNKILGSIAFQSHSCNDVASNPSNCAQYIGLFVDSRDNAQIGWAEDNTIENFVSYQSEHLGAYLRSPVNLTCTNCSFLSTIGHPSNSNLKRGFLVDQWSGAAGGFTQDSITCTNCLFGNNPGNGSYINSDVSSWLVEYSNSYNNSMIDFPSDITCPNCYSNTISQDPGLNSCIAYLPEASRMRGTGKNGGDIGANVLYRYQDGTLTTTPLWSSAGAFPCGAIVSGYNDTGSTSCSQVHVRLNINTGSCSFPSSLYPNNLNSSASSLTPSNSSGNSICSTNSPGIKAPSLYAAIPQNYNSILLYFTDADEPYDHYALTFGNKTGEYIWGSNNIAGKGSRTYSVNNLNPNTTYYFRIRAGNGCATGNWSNEISAKTLNKTISASLDPTGNPSDKTSTEKENMQTNPEAPVNFEKDYINSAETFNQKLSANEEHFSERALGIITRMSPIILTLLLIVTAKYLFKKLS